MKSIHKHIDRAEQETEDLLINIRHRVEETEARLREGLEEILEECEKPPEDLDGAYVREAIRDLIKWIEQR